jgi:hypothetical protein
MKKLVLILAILCSGQVKSQDQTQSPDAAAMEYKINFHSKNNCMIRFYSANTTITQPTGYDGWAETHAEKQVIFKVNSRGVNVIYLVMKKHNAAQVPKWKVDFDIEHRGKKVLTFNQSGKNNFNGVFAIVLTPSRTPEQQTEDNSKINYANSDVDIGADVGAIE